MTKEIAKLPVTKETVRALASAESFARGRSYLDDGAVSDASTRRPIDGGGGGSEFEPYRASTRLHDGGVADAHCTCPYDWGGYCKHVVAVLLKLADERTRVIERKPLAELLAGLNQARLIELFEKRGESDPELATWIEAELATARPTQSPGRTDAGRRRTPVDPAPARTGSHPAHRTESARTLLGRLSTVRRYRGGAAARRKGRPVA
jgi:uncharacterized Zn finger protein